MATWQGSNGGLLAGIGGVNSNAPSVNDIGNTLQLIRQNNDIERSGANNVGLTALQGLSGIAGGGSAGKAGSAAERISAGVR